MSEKKQFFIKTYGCQMNVYDSERMAEALGRSGYAQTDDQKSADLVILNTCHIREKATEKVYSEIGRIRARDDRSNDEKRTKIAVAGCVAQAEGDEIIARAPAVNLVFGPQTYHRLPDMISRIEAGERVIETDFPEEDKFEHLPERKKQSGPVTAFVTVQEGCDKFCSFCVVPYTRGNEVSRPVQQIVDEAKALADSGVRELTLLGQNVNAYHGLDANGTSRGLGHLLEVLSDINGLDRLRYTTSHPRDMSDELIEAHRDLPKLMPYLHLPVQSGSNKILKAMNRQHERDVYFSMIERIRAVRPDLALSGDFIVGYPGESDEDFEDTLDLVRQVGYAQAFSFKYSPRPGTPGSLRQEQVPEDVKSARLQVLQSLLSEQQIAFNKAKIGTMMPILLEKPGRKDNQLIGRSPWLQAVHITSQNHVIGDLITVAITDATMSSLTGSLDTIAMQIADAPSVQLGGVQ